MIFPTHFSFMGDFEDEPKRLSKAEREAFTSLGLLPEDLDAIERASGFVRDLVGGKEAGALSALFPLAMLHYRRHGESILDSLGWCFEPIAARNWPETVGADSLFGKARCDVEKFEISNIYRPFYSRLFAARIRRFGNPRDDDRIAITASWADYLVRAEWPPITTGEDA